MPPINRVRTRAVTQSPTGGARAAGANSRLGLLGLLAARVSSGLPTGPTSPHSHPGLSTSHWYWCYDGVFSGHPTLKNTVTSWDTGLVTASSVEERPALETQAHPRGLDHIPTAEFRTAHQERPRLSGNGALPLRPPQATLPTWDHQVASPSLPLPRGPCRPQGCQCHRQPTRCSDTVSPL